MFVGKEFERIWEKQTVTQLKYSPCISQSETKENYKPCQ